MLGSDDVKTNQELGDGQVMASVVQRPTCPWPLSGNTSGGALAIATYIHRSPPVTWMDNSSCQGRGPDQGETSRCGPPQPVRTAPVAVLLWGPDHLPVHFTNYSALAVARPQGNSEPRVLSVLFILLYLLRVPLGDRTGLGIRKEWSEDVWLS